MGKALSLSFGYSAVIQQFCHCFIISFHNFSVLSVNSPEMKKERPSFTWLNLLFSKSVMSRRAHSQVSDDTPSQELDSVLWLVLFWPVQLDIAVGCKRRANSYYFMNIAFVAKCLWRLASQWWKQSDLRLPNNTYSVICLIRACWKASQSSKPSCLHCFVCTRQNVLIR